MKYIYTIFLCFLSLFFTGCTTTVVQSIEKNPGDLLVYFLDIGQGDATLLEFQNGEQMLIDCAIDARILESLGKYIPFSDKTLEYLVITHPDQDHYGGCVDVMKNFEVKNIIYTGFEKKNSFFPIFEKSLEDEKIEGANYILSHEWGERNIASSTVEVLFPNAAIENLQIKDSNASSIILKITHGEKKMLLMGDAEEEEEIFLEEFYGAEELDIDVLKVGHHGSAHATSKHFLQYTTPDYGIISSGADNSYGHPSPRVLKKLERAGAEVLRTDQKNDIIMRVGGGKELNNIYVQENT